MVNEVEGCKNDDEIKQKGNKDEDAFDQEDDQLNEAE